MAASNNKRQRQRELPVESSWRMVEGGDNDSFDTSIVPDMDLLDDPDIPLSSDPSHISSQGQLSSVGTGSQESHHSIHDFVDHAEDDRVILRSPFRPSIPSTRQASSSSTEVERRHQHRTPDPEFYMPSMRAAGPRQSGSSGRSSRTVRPADAYADDGGSLRQRAQRQESYGSPTSNKRRTNAAAGQRSGGQYYHNQGDTRERTAAERITDALPGTLVSIVAWVCDVLSIALKILKYPVAICLALYILFGGLIVVQNMLTKSVSASLSPLCRAPGVSYLDLPFCPKFGQDTPSGTPDGRDASDDENRHVEFDDLMDVQSSFEKVLERSADGVSLPMEMKRSESSIRDLRTMVRYSELPQRDELVYEFNEYIDTSRQTASDLQKFNTHVGSAVDSVISINRWTSRYIDSLAPPETSDGSGNDLDPTSTSTSAIAAWAAWLFSPFQPATSPAFDERALLDKYVEHTALVSDRIASLIVEAQAVLRLLTRAEDHLSLIYDVVTRSQRDVKSRRDDVLWTLWTLVGANSRRIGDLDAQLGLLKSVDAQRSAAVAQVSALVVELEKIQAGLGDLRDRVAEPGIARDAAAEGIHGKHAGGIPLSVHIETIDRGVERLEEARKRIREAENEKVREALARGGVAGQGERLIEGRR